MQVALQPPDVLDDAIAVLTARWGITPSRAALALMQVAEALPLTVGDLAALVCAAHHQEALVGPVEPE